MSVYHKENPFIKSLVNQYSERQVRGYKERFIQNGNSPTDLLTDESGEPVKIKTPGLLVKKASDSQEFIKLFRDSIPILLELRRPALDALFYIMSVLKPKHDYIEFDTKELASFCGYKSRQSVYNAIDDLVEAKILARRHNSKRGHQTFWINPEVIYNGCRNSLYNKSKNMIQTHNEYLIVCKLIDEVQSHVASGLSAEEEEDAKKYIQDLSMKAIAWEQEHNII